uniref:Uncharacterized protein n=1 Tax=Cucumis melo TaxID=3656 RepID=A0A9I9E8M9_CUCME
MKVNPNTTLENAPHGLPKTAEFIPVILHPRNTNPVFSDGDSLRWAVMVPTSSETEQIRNLNCEVSSNEIRGQNCKSC